MTTPTPQYLTPPTATRRHGARTVPPVPEDTPPAVRDAVAVLDAELDDLHPGWRTFQPFAHMEYERLAAVKLRLLRRKLLLNREVIGQGPTGAITRPAPLDWAVRIVPSPRDHRMCFAQPVPPRVETAPQIQTSPPLGLAIHTPHPTATKA